jgi:uncharacterized repeat protein (TIGR03847 family)
MTLDFGLVRAVQAQSFGEPGGRTFRLRLVGAASQSASLWMEKEHLGALGLALRQALAEFKHDQEASSADIAVFPDVAEYDFRVGRMGIGLDVSGRTVVLQVDELGNDQDRELRFRLSLDQSAALSAELEHIIAAGRPVCPLCGRPIDPAGHMCVRSNGHSEEPVPDADSGDGS